MSFTEKLDPESLAYFNQVAQKPFNQQAVAFLNAYWPEVHDQAEFIFTYASLPSALPALFHSDLVGSARLIQRIYARHQTIDHRWVWDLLSHNFYWLDQ